MKLLFIFTLIISLPAWAQKEPLGYRLFVKNHAMLEKALENAGLKIKSCVFIDHQNNQFSFQGISPCLYKNFFNEGIIHAVILMQDQNSMIVTIKWHPYRNYYQYLVHVSELLLEPTIIWITNNIVTHPAYNKLISKHIAIEDLEIIFQKNYKIKNLKLSIKAIGKKQAQVLYSGKATLTTQDSKETIIDLNTNINLLRSNRTFFIKGSAYEK